jgi:hypothetical protein
MTDDRTWSTNSTDLWYRFNNGVPNQLTQTISPWINNARAGWDAVFAQEQFTMRRLTLQAAVRWDVARSWFPEQNIGPDRFLPVAYHFEESKGIDSYKDITHASRRGVRRVRERPNCGEGKLRALPRGRRCPAELRQHQSDDAYSDIDRSVRRAGVTRTWIDANSNFVPDCDLSNPQANGNAAATPGGGGPDFCGVISNLRFGQPVLTGNYDRTC